MPIVIDAITDPAAHDGRLALVIGGGGGIGVASCRALARMGCIIAVADVDAAKADGAARALPGRGHRAFVADAASEAAVDTLFEAVELAMGPISIIVYVAGGPGIDPAVPQRIADTPTEVWTEVLRLNAGGLFVAARAFLARRRAVPVEHGRLITIGSMAGVAPSGLHTGAAYAAAKAAAINLTRYVALEAAPLGITANAVAPATILTDKVRGAMTEAQLAAIAAQTPVGRLGRPENIAAAVAYFASRDADFSTGCVLEINGGRHMG